MQSKSKKKDTLIEVIIDYKNYKQYNEDMVFQLRNKGRKRIFLQ